MRWLLPCCFCLGLLSAAASATPAQPGPVVASPAKPVTTGPYWHELTPVQRQLLAPVATDWNGFSSPKKQRLLNVAKRYPDMSPAEQAKIRERLPHWTELPQTTRDEARNNMKKLLQLPPDERKRTEEKLRAKLAPPAAVAPAPIQPPAPAAPSVTPATSPLAPAPVLGVPPPVEPAKPVQ